MSKETGVGSPFGGGHSMQGVRGAGLYRGGRHTADATDGDAAGASTDQHVVASEGFPPFLQVWNSLIQVWESSDQLIQAWDSSDQSSMCTASQSGSWSEAFVRT